MPTEKDVDNDFVSYGEALLSPIKLNSELSKICDLLDNFYEKYPKKHKKQKASDLIKGAFYMTRPECRSNPDWMSQSANSARDLLYPLLSVGSKSLIKLFKDYAKNEDIENSFSAIFSNLDIFYRKLTDITHHGTDLKGFGSESEFISFTADDYVNLLRSFSLVLGDAFNYQQLYIHHLIDLIIVKKQGKKTKEDLNLILNINDDARQYFFSNTDVSWLSWLQKNDFLNFTRFSTETTFTKTSELYYLNKMVSEKPDFVTKIIFSTKINQTNFNPVVVDQFIRTSQDLPARCLKKIIQKIKKEKWVKLRGKYVQYGFEYSTMFKKLYESGDNKSILVLAQAILLTRSDKDIEEINKSSYKKEHIFYIHDLCETKVFKYLAEMPEDLLDDSLSIIIKPFLKSIDKKDNYLLMDEDLFVLKLRDFGDYGYRDELKYLLSTILEIMRRISVSNKYNIREIYEKYFLNKSNNRLFIRLNWFVLSLNPEIFKNELKSEYFRLFEVTKKLDILYGAEYEQMLKTGFSSLTNIEKRSYIEKVFDLFTKFKNEDEQRWNRHYASCILSMISGYLNEDDIKKASNNGFKIDSKYKPEPSMGKVTGGTVNPKSPIKEEDFAKLEVKDIVAKLKLELSPNELQEKYKNDNFLSPRNAEGVAQQLENDIKVRINDYLTNATLFFDRDKLNPHYTETYLNAIKKTLSGDRNSLDNLDFNNLFELLIKIKDSGNGEAFNSKRESLSYGWLSNWISVHLSVASLLQELMTEKDGKVLLDFNKYRSQLLDIITYLFKFNDPIPEDEKIELAKNKVKYPNESDYFVSDPFTCAINSVRGVTFESLVHFVYLDSKNKDAKKTKLSDDVKELYQNVLTVEKTRAIMFMFGRYLYYFYFRDIDWMKSLWKEIFESETKDKYLCLAAWEGYITNNLYSEVFFEPYIQNIYLNKIKLKTEYPKQKFFKDPSEALPIHLALAFVNFKEFDLNHPLFKEFLEKSNTKQLSEFISFIGGSYISNESSNVLRGANNQWKVDKIKTFWDLLISSKKNSESLKEFGHWINTRKDIWNIGWLANEICQTLKITDGLLEWSYGLLESIEKLAEESPKQTLEILELYIYSTMKRPNDYLFFREDKQWYNAFKILYENEKIKKSTYELINKLIKDGGQRFWILEEIVKQNDKPL